MTHCATGATGLLLILVAGLAGCGGGDDTATKASFAKQADAICARGNKEVAVLNRRIGEAQRSSDEKQVFAEMARLTKQSVGVSTRYLDQLDALETPEADRDRLKAWLADNRRQVAIIGQLSDAFAAADATRIATLSEQADRINTKSNAFALAYGMRECGRST